MFKVFAFPHWLIKGAHYCTLTSKFLVEIEKFNHNEKNEEFKLDMVSAYVMRSTIACEKCLYFLCAIKLL